MKLSAFDYHLPEAFIAQTPIEPRDHSKLMVVDRNSKQISHHQFFELPDILDSNYVLVFNQSRVIPARLKFKLNDKEAEILLIKEVRKNRWECMVKPGKKFKVGMEHVIDETLSFKVSDINEHGLRVIEFETDELNAYLKTKGHTPLPPYIEEKLDDPERYQTIYSKDEGSVAAPTAGLHFTKRVFEGLEEKGIETAFVTLHVGLGTFQPVKTEEVEDHKMHFEYYELPEATAKKLNEAKKAGKKIIAVGTTSIRVLESCTEDGLLKAGTGETGIFITPGYEWKFIDGLITNFHVPKSTLLMLVSALAGREFMLEAYEKAKENNYRFFSFGDSMFIR